jgi:hypothetical protein
VDSLMACGGQTSYIKWVGGNWGFIEKAQSLLHLM